MLEGVKKVFKVIIDILTAFMFLILVLIIIAKIDMTVNNRDYFSMFGYSFFKVATGSMEPNISENDIIVVKNHADYSKGDIITYEESNAYITHRIISINNNTIITKGDANNTNDAPIASDSVIGRVVADYKNLEVWRQILTTPSILVSIFITLILFDLAFSVKPKIKEVKVDPPKVEDEPIKVVEIPKEENTIKKVTFTEEEKEKILELTQTIELPKLREIQKDDESMPDLSDSEINKLESKFKSSNSMPRLDKKEKDFMNYTIRLDLTELQNKINGKMNSKKK